MTVGAAALQDIQQEALALLEWPRLCEHLADCAVTPMGRSALLRLRLPAEPRQSLQLQEETRDMLTCADSPSGGVSFRGVADIGNTVGLCRKHGVATAASLVDVATTLAAARRLRGQLEEPELRPVITARLLSMPSLKQLEQQLNNCLEEGGRVADRASPALAACRRELAALQVDLRRRLQQLLQCHQAVLQDNVVSLRQGRAVLALKAGALDQLPGIVHDSSASGSTLFVEPRALVPLGNRIRALEAREEEEETVVLRRLSRLVEADAERLHQIRDALLWLDVAQARARYADLTGGIQPAFVGEEAAPDGAGQPEATLPPIVLDGLRHPLLVWQQLHGGPDVVPVDVRVSPRQRVVVITGPNTGGKTVVLKALGLALLMARAGLPVPCRGAARLPWAALVLADIGDDQSLQHSLSTFSSHVGRQARIVKAVQATPSAGRNAVVLLDEVGAGTDPGEGEALATALLEQLADQARLTVATTHYGALKALKYHDERFENASVSFDDNTLSPTYQLQWGIPGRSNALVIAARCGLAATVVERAGVLVSSRQERNVNLMISGLEEQRQRQQEATEAATALLEQAEALHQELLQQWQNWQNDAARHQEQRRQALVQSITEGQQEVRRIIRDLRQRPLDGERSRVAGQQLKRLKATHGAHHAGLAVRQVQQNRPQSGWCPREGMRVRLLTLGKAATVLAVKDGGRLLEVRCGTMRVRVARDAVEALPGETALPPAPQPAQDTGRYRQPSGPEVRCSANTVDLRGLRLHEAEAAVTDQLNRAAGPLWLVHGIGSGRLKCGLREWLQTLDHVERIHDAEPGDGGVGCTVVWPRR